MNDQLERDIRNLFLPDYLHEDLCNAMKVLDKIVLEKQS